jgi:hypothetical protein
MQMKRISSVLPGVILLAALTASISGFAANTASTSVHFTTPVRVGSNDLPAGDYKVTWTDSGSDTQVSFVQGKKVVATVPAKVVRAENNNISLETDTPQGSSTAVLEGINLAHLTLTFGSVTTAQR